MNITFRFTVFIVGAFLFLLWVGSRGVKTINFDRECGGYLHRAAIANTVEMAKTELTTGLEYMERHDMTEGFTSVWWRSPSEDVGFWYNNLKSALAELNTLSADATVLEKSNTLMKLRESLIDDSSGTSMLIAPDGITIFPDNKGYTTWAFLSLSVMILGAVGLFSMDL